MVGVQGKDHNSSKEGGASYELVNKHTEINRIFTENLYL